MSRIHFSVTVGAAWLTLTLAITPRCPAELDVNQIVLAVSYANQFSSEGNDVQAKGMISEALPPGTSADDIYDWYLRAALELLGQGDPAAEKLYKAAAEASGKKLSQSPIASYGAAIMAQRRGDSSEAERLIKDLHDAGSSSLPPESKAYALLYDIAKGKLTTPPLEAEAYGGLYVYAAGACCENALVQAQANYERDHDAVALKTAIESVMPRLKTWWGLVNGSHLASARVAYDNLVAFCQNAHLPPPPSLDEEPATVASAPTPESALTSEPVAPKAEAPSFPEGENFGATVSPGYFSAATQTRAAESAAALERGDAASAQSYETWIESQQLSSFTRSGLCVLRGLFHARNEAWELATADWKRALTLDPKSVPALAALAYAESRTPRKDDDARSAYLAAYAASGKQGEREEDDSYFDTPALGRRLLAAAAINNDTAKLSGDDIRNLIEQELARPMDGNVFELEFALLTAYSDALGRGEGHLFGKRDLAAIERFSQDLLQRAQAFPGANESRNLATRLQEYFLNQKDAALWIAYAQAPNESTKAVGEAAWKRLHERDPLWPGRSLPLAVADLPDIPLYQKLKALLSGPAPVANDEKLRDYEALWWAEWRTISEEPDAKDTLKTRAAPLLRVQALLQYLQLAALPANDRNLRTTVLRFSRYLTLAACCDEVTISELNRHFTWGYSEIKSQLAFGPTYSPLYGWLHAGPDKDMREYEACDDLATLTAAADAFAPFSPLERALLSDKILKLLPNLTLQDPEALQLLSNTLTVLAPDAQHPEANLQALRDWNRKTDGSFPSEVSDEFLSTPLGNYCASFDTWLTSRPTDASTTPKVPGELALEPAVILRSHLLQFLGTGPDAAAAFDTPANLRSAPGAAALTFSDVTTARWMSYAFAVKLAAFRQGPKSSADVKAIMSWISTREEAAKKSTSAMRREVAALLVTHARAEVALLTGDWRGLATLPN